MSKRSQEKRRAKAREKKLSHRRMLGSSPLSRLAGAAEETCECWMLVTDDDPIISFHVVRPVRGGQGVGAFFLIDPECIGLKDAFCRLDIDPIDLREGLRERSRTEDLRLVRVTLAEVRQKVAAAIRWTLAHPFILPADTERCLKILDGVGDVASADVSGFGDEDGDLYYVGSEEDLVARLQGITLEEFMERDDVTCEFYTDEEMSAENEEYDYEEEDEEDGGPVAENDRQFRVLANEMVRCVVDGTKEWCQKTGTAPSSELDRAAHIHVASIFSAISVAAAGKKGEEAQAEGCDFLEEMLDHQPDEVMPEVERGLDQIMKSGAGHPERVVAMALDRTRGAGPAIVDISPKDVLHLEPPCSTPDSPNSPPSSSTTPAPSRPATTS